MKTTSLKINTYVKVNPVDLGESLLAVTKTNLRSEYINRSYKETGRVIDIIDNDTIILDSVIKRSSSDIFMYVSCTFTMYKPEIGDEFITTVSSIFPEGVFVNETTTHQKIFVPILADDSTRQITTGSTLTIRIADVRFKDREYRVIGSVV